MQSARLLQARLPPIVADVDIALVAVAGATGLAFGWFAAGWQHLLYRQAEYRDNPMSGARLLRYRLALAVVCAAGAALALRPGHYDPGPAVLSGGFVLVLSVLSSTDFERRIIPNRLLYPALVAAAASCRAWPDRSVADIWLGAAFAAGVAGGLFAIGLLLGAALKVRGTLFGLGDVKLILLIGLLAGWPAVMSALFIGVLAAGVPSLFLLARGGASRYFSYGPYLALGGAVVMLWPGRFV